MEHTGAPLDLTRSLGNGTWRSRIGIESPARTRIPQGFHSTTLLTGVTLAHDD
ncbi:MAG: hypothetical protein AAF941_03895 [Pseudomonadota bacterium]